MRLFEERDNTELADKLALRMTMLNIAKLPALHVLDLCAGSGSIWRQLRQKFPVTTYLPCDKKPRLAGSLRLDMNEERNLECFDMAKYNVVDIDPYGDPFVPYLALLKRVTHKTLFFLTHSAARAWGNVGQGKPSLVLRRGNGIPLDWDVPGCTNEFWLYLGQRLLMKSSLNVNIDKLLVGQNERFTRYYGLIATPKTTKERVQ